MFIVTARIPKKKIVAAGAGLLCCCVALVAGLFCTGRVTAASADAVPRRVKSNEERVAYLENLGWAVKEEAIAIEELLIPETFDASYDEYLSLQAAQGFDLTAYCGKRVKRYSYEVTNHPSGETGVQAALLIYKNTIIGGEVLSPKPDGFLHGLDMPSGETIKNSA